MMSASKPQHDPPISMEPYDLGGENDLGALSDDQQTKLNQFKIETRLANEKYLRNHPEIGCMMSAFLRELYIIKPDNVREFSAEYFTDPCLRNRVQELLLQREDDIKKNRVLQKIHDS